MWLTFLCDGQKLTKSENFRPLDVFLFSAPLSFQETLVSLSAGAVTLLRALLWLFFFLTELEFHVVRRLFDFLSPFALAFFH